MNGLPDLNQWCGRLGGSLISLAEVTEVVKKLFGARCHVESVAWRLGTVPVEWQTGVVVPIFKKGDRRVCSNYRGITLLNPVNVCFVDLEKAYDHVPWRILWGVLQEYGVPGPLVRAIRSLYEQSARCVRILGTKSSTFSVGVGLHQGCPLSPILFVIFMDRISRRSRGERECLVWGPRNCVSALCR